MRISPGARGCMSLRSTRGAADLAAVLILLLAQGAARLRAQAALLMEEPYGLAGRLNPTGHDAIYFARICAVTPVKLRRCAAGEMGVVIARYKSVAGYDWLAVPLIPYLYAVERADEVPAQTDRNAVTAMRRAYVAAHVLAQIDPAARSGSHAEDWYKRQNWYELSGSAYDRSIYAFRFDTTEKQDDAFIAHMNAAPNRSHFSLVRNNCADFAAGVLGFYFPHAFHRRLLPDADITTPRENAWELERYARRPPGFEVTVDKIPQVPGSRRASRGNKSVAESLVVTGDLLPFVAIPYAGPVLGGAVCVDFLVWGRYPLRHKGAEILTPENVAALGAAPAGTLSANVSVER
jgi:hypothetical protein